jgi:hypothetical protein
VLSVSTTNHHFPPPPPQSDHFHHCHQSPLQLTTTTIHLQQVHHELELGVVIGKVCTRGKAADWADYVAGYVLGLDMTARDLQNDAKKKVVIASTHFTHSNCTSDRRAFSFFLSVGFFTYSTLLPSHFALLTRFSFVHFSIILHHLS